tara:strand:+ start:817 stop:1323 length:507 start_codon:yes stop_codon:yes gene_type:complete
MKERMVQIKSFLLIALSVVASCEGYHYPWKTVKVMRDNYRQRFPYDGSILDQKISCYVNDKLIIRENKPLYESLVKKVRGVLEKQKHVRVEITKVDCDIKSFSFHWKIDINALQKYFYINGLSLYKTNDSGTVLSHSLFLNKVGIAQNLFDVYVHPKFFRAIRVKGNQ